MAHVLLVDNDRPALLACASELGGDGHDIHIATTGDEALRLFEQHRPDVVVTEVCLPGIDGLDLMNRVLAQDRTTLVILNCRSAVHQANFMSWAADAYVVKSADNHELRAKIAALLASRLTARLLAAAAADPRPARRTQVPRTLRRHVPPHDVAPAADPAGHGAKHRVH